MSKRQSIEDTIREHTFVFEEGDDLVNQARLKYQTKKKVTAPKLWSSMTEGQRKQWREWYRKEQELKTAKKSTTKAKESSDAEAED